MKTLRLSACVFLIAFSYAGVAAAAKPANAGAALPTIDIPYTKYVLDNGLILIVHEDHKAPVVATMSGTTWAARTRSPAAPASPISSST